MEGPYAGFFGGSIGVVYYSVYSNDAWMFCHNACRATDRCGAWSFYWDTGKCVKHKPTSWDKIYEADGHVAVAGILPDRSGGGGVGFDQGGTSSGGTTSDSGATSDAAATSEQDAAADHIYETFESMTKELCASGQMPTWMVEMNCGDQNGADSAATTPDPVPPAQHPARARVRLPRDRAG